MEATLTTIAARAQAAYTEQLAQDLARQEQDAIKERLETWERLRTAVARVLTVELPETVPPDSDGRTATIDGITVSAHGRQYLNLHRPCPVCGTLLQLLSYFGTLVELGSMLSREPETCYDCSRKAQATSPRPALPALPPVVVFAATYSGDNAATSAGADVWGQVETFVAEHGAASHTNIQDTHHIHVVADGGQITYVLTVFFYPQGAADDIPF